MTKEQIIHSLEKNLLSFCKDIKTSPTVVTWRGEKKKSEWSRKIDIPEGNSLCGYLKSIFGISNHNWDELFKQATSGLGQEAEKISTLHSSSLLALLYFSNVTKESPLYIDGIGYTKVWFEVKNKVFDKPSNIDVVLGNEDEDLLFIESKFTEYLFPDNSSFAKKYLNFYANILPRIEGYPLRMLYPRKYDGKDGMGLEASSDAKLYSHLYMNGIKQCFSHLIGLCQGPDDDSCLQWGKFKGKIRFATILFYFPGDEFRAYRDFYSNTVGRITATDLKASIATIPEIKDNHTDHIEVAPAVYLYQDVFKDFELPKNIKKYYDL